MRTRSRLMFAGLAAVMLMLAAVGAASANRLSVNEQHYRIVWTSLEFVEPFGGAVLCPVTLEGSFHSATITKTVGSLIGYITAASVRGGSGAGECIGGTATVLQASLPWHVRYRGFRGTLPNVERVEESLVGAAFQIHSNSFGVTCLARTEANNPAVGIAEKEAGGNWSRLTAEPGASISCGGFFSGRFRGTGTLERQGTTRTDIVITLI